MADGGHHHHGPFPVRRGQLIIRRSAPPDDGTTRYVLRPEFPFKTAKLMFGMAVAKGTGSSAEMVVGPPERKQPLEDEDLLTEILCRLPPLPSPLARAWLVSKPWARLGASASFRRRLQARYREPPILGVYHRYARDLLFIPTMDAPDAIPPERFSLKVVTDHATDWWMVLGYRQGRVLVVNRIRKEFLVFEPVSGERHIVAFPRDFVKEACVASGGVVVDELHGPLVEKEASIRHL
jgi:hypothetical protein